MDNYTPRTEIKESNTLRNLGLAVALATTLLSTGCETLENCCTSTRECIYNSANKPQRNLPPLFRQANDYR